jgi:hypothetical protein
MFRGSWILAAAGLLALGAAAHGQGIAIGVAEGPDVKVDVRVAEPSEYWIGVVLAAPAEDEQPGIKVADVMPDGPAAKAGIRAGDRLTKAGGKPIKEVGDLIGAIDAAKGKPVGIELVRDGEPQKLQVTPQKRPMPARPFGELLPPGQDWDNWRKWAEKLEQRQLDEPFQFRFFGPGAVVPRAIVAGKPQPDDMTITLTKKGQEPARIVVKQGDESWRTTEDKLGELPDEVRPHVERLLGRGFGAWGRVKVMEGPKVHVQPQPLKAEPLKVLPRDELRKRLDQRLERIDKQIEELRKSLDELRKKRAEGAETEKTP